MKNVWKNLEDSKFYDQKMFNHVFFYGVVTAELVSNLYTQLMIANKKNKPVVIHVSSFGGDANQMKVMQNMFSLMQVPVCCLIDGVCMSAATDLFLSAPYKVAVSHGLFLIHQYSTMINGKIANRRRDSEYDRELIESTYDHYKQMLVNKTKLSKRQIEDLLKRDKYLNADECIKYGIYDRVIDVKPSKSQQKLKKLTMKPDWINIFDHRTEQESDNEEPYQWMLERLLNFSKKKPVLLVLPEFTYNIDNVANYKLLDMLLPIISYIKYLRSTGINVYGVVVSDVNIYEMLIASVCTYSFIFENVNVSVASRFMTSKKSGMLPDPRDTIENTQVMIDVCSKLTSKDFNNLISDDHDLVTGDKVVDLGLIDQLLTVNKS